ncbi:MAG: hypothetical protein Q4C65_04195 [Eubacteriales bacterium]|nr:hypothetical protein [Eubacteriales bacterium]
MKKKYTMLALGLAFNLAILGGCGSTASQETQQTQPAETGQETAESETADAAQETAVSGEVTTVSDSSITVETENGAREIAVTADTAYTRQMPEGEPPQRPDGDGGDAPERTAPEEGQRPEGEDGQGAPEGTAPEDGQRPEGEDGRGAPAGTAPEGAAPEGAALTLADIAVGDTVEITLDADGNARTVAVRMDQPGGGGMSSQPESYDAVQEYTEDGQVSDESVSSTGTDENAILVSGRASVSMENMTISRESADSTGGDTSSFYGVGAAVLVTEGTAELNNSTVTTDAAGGAGVFAYGDGTAYVKDTEILTEQDTSGGIHVAGGGTLCAWDLTVETNGESSAAIRSDRGSGTMVVDGGSYVSNGTGSPAVYSTADITVHNAELTANQSEAVCIEGLNQLRLYQCDLTGTMQDLDQNDCTWNVILYQSMSGDSEVGNSTFEMQGGSLTAKNGGIFYTTNTESTFYISGVEITAAQGSEFFLKCTGNDNQRGWGSAGANGADCDFTAEDQQMEGDIIWDSISSLDFYMAGASTLTGAVLQDESCAGEGGSGYANVYIGEESTWVVTGDSVLTNLYCAGTIVDAEGNSVTVQGSDGTVYAEGDSAYTVTVESWSEEADMSSAYTATEWEDYSVSRA